LNALFRKWGSVLLLCLSVTFANGAGFGSSPEKVSLSDPRVQPMLRAMDQVDRAALGFTPVTASDDIRLELTQPGGAYDAMLHLSGATTRTIAFRKTDAGYRWIFEQESREGPGWWQTPDGAVRESILMEYQTEHVDGVPLNQVFVRYTGADTNLSGRDLTLAEAQPILTKWATTPVQPRPPDSGNEEFNPALFLILVVSVIALIIAAILALIALAIGLCAIFVLLTAGTISTAVIVGYLRRSVSAGFRTFFIVAGAIIGLGSGVIAVCLVNAVKKVSWTLPLPWAIGAMTGIGIGILCAWLFNQTWSYVVKRFSST
jgi:hypothetical protein